jgi:shikimate O-hydroxycinnamoyltransferase
VRHFVVASSFETLAFYARLAMSARRLVSRVFRFSPDEVSRIKRAAADDLGDAGRWVSTNDAVTAHLWKCVVELRARDPASRESLGLIASVRERLAPDVPPHYFGNCASHTTPSLTAGELRTRPVGAIATLVREGLEGNTPEKLRGEIAFLAAHHEARRPGRILPRMMLEVFGSSVTFNNWSKLPFYALDFGAGRPFWYDVPAIPIPWLLCVAPTPADDGGRDVHLTLPEHRLARYHSRAWQASLHRHQPE